MDEPRMPQTPAALRRRLAELREVRRKRIGARSADPAQRVRRRSLRSADRELILAKTDQRCHLCGGSVVSEWEADHVLAFAGGGAHSVENYLAAHALCNNYRWDYEPEEFQWALKIGVWARLHIEKGTPVGAAMLQEFFKYEVNRDRRRKARRAAEQGAASS
jgi:hypothetical protein